jgi:hypothetical protein
MASVPGTDSNRAGFSPDATSDNVCYVSFDLWISCGKTGLNRGPRNQILRAGLQVSNQTAGIFFSRR